MPNLKMFDEVIVGQQFIDPDSNQLCRKLFEGCIPKSQMVISQPESGPGMLILKETCFRNAVVDNTGCLIHIPSERQVQVFL